MKTSTLALGALSLLPAIAQAQSSVTLYGVADAAISRISSTGRAHVTGMSSGGLSASRLGIRGTEDLGGGMAASFLLEGGISLDTGGQSGFAFTRRSTVSLSGRLGEIRLGRDYAPTYWNVGVADPYAGRGIGAIAAKDNFGFGTIRNNNSVGYVLPDGLGGFYGQVQVSLSEKRSDAPNRKQGSYAGGRFGYAHGPLNAALAYGRYQQVIGASDAAPVTIGRDLSVANMLVSWNFGVVKPSLFYGQEKVSNGPAGNSQLDSIYLSLTAPIGASELRLAFGHYDRKDSANDFNQWVVGYVYNLSKRTALYATGAHIRNKGASAFGLSVEGIAPPGVAAGGKSTGFDLGVRHTF